MAKYGCSKYSAENARDELKALAVAAESYSRALDLCAQNEAKLNALDAEITDLERELSDFFESFGLDGEYEEELDRAIRTLAFIETQTSELKRLRDVAESFKAEKGITVEPEAPTVDKAELEERLAELRNEGNALIERRAKLSEAIKKLEEEAEQLPSLKDEKEELVAKTESYGELVRAYDGAMEYLEKAKQSLSSRYTVDMKNSFEQRFSELASSESEVTVDVNLGVELRGEGGMHKSDGYSMGYKALIALCLRLSLIDSLYGEEKPFIILDDPFVNLDDEKLARSLEMLRELSKSMQIVYLTCHSSRSLRA